MASTGTLLFLHCLCDRPNRPHYGSSPSVRLSVPYVFLTRKQKKRRKTKLV